MSRVLLAFDKFRGTATREELHAACRSALEADGHTVVDRVLSDGGEGSLAAYGGPNRWSVVTGPLGDAVQAGWRLENRASGGPAAFIEMAEASGLALVGGAEGNDALSADTYGTGELIGLAHAEGAKEITVFVGGSATTDGGLGAQRAMPLPPRLRGLALTVATDVSTLFVDAATVFGPQKGATPAQVALLTRRLERLADMYVENYGVDVRTMSGAGAAGGLAGGLAALGARITSGFEVLAEAAELDLALAEADIVLTGEGFCDSASFQGKVVGGVARWAAEAGVPVAAIVGNSDLSPEEVPPGVTVISLTESFGYERSIAQTAKLVADVARSVVNAGPSLE